MSDVIERPAATQQLDVRAVPVFGSVLFGTHWQADLGRAIGLSRSQISRIMKNLDPKLHLLSQEKQARAVRTMPVNFSISLKEVVLKKILDLAALLDTPGMPYHDTPEMEEAQKHILKAAKLLRGETHLRR